MFHPPECAGVRGQIAAAAKVMRLAGNQIHRGAAAGVEIRVVGLPCRVDGHQHALAIHTAFKNQLAGYAVPS